MKITTSIKKMNINTYFENLTVGLYVKIFFMYNLDYKNL